MVGPREEDFWGDGIISAEADGWGGFSGEVERLV